MTHTSDVIVIGGGIVGGAVAFGLARCGLAVTVLDEGDVAFRTSRGSFGLVWVQSKGVGVPEYHRWSRQSADDWPDFAREMQELSGVDTGHRRPGGVSIALDEKEWLARRANCERIRAEAGDLGFDFEMLDRDGMAKLVPGLGPTVVGGCYTRYDGDANPLSLLRALHGAMRAAGVRYVPGDVRSPGDLTALAKVDAIVECSAEPSALAGVHEPMTAVGPGQVPAPASIILQLQAVGQLHADGAAKSQKALGVLLLSTALPESSICSAKTFNLLESWPHPCVLTSPFH